MARRQCITKGKGELSVSSKQAQLYHSITIGDKNTWDDWHLVPSTRPSFAMPEVKTNYVEVPGMSGMLDLSQALTGKVIYGNRSGSLSFIVMNDYGSWETRYSEIADYLHGKAHRCILDDDPGYYYEGRFALEPWQTGKGNSAITINYTLNPFKIEVLGSEEDMLWDTFNLTLGYVREYKNIRIPGGSVDTDILVMNDEMEVIPTITVTNNMKVKFNGDTYYDLSNSGENKIRKIKLQPGENHLIFKASSTGNVTIAFHPGRL